jgi:transposase-like protein
MYLRHLLSYQDVTDLRAERGLDVDGSTVSQWVQKADSGQSKQTD